MSPETAFDSSFPRGASLTPSKEEMLPRNHPWPCRNNQRLQSLGPNMLKGICRIRTVGAPAKSPLTASWPSDTCQASGVTATGHSQTDHGWCFRASKKPPTIASDRLPCSGQSYLEACPAKMDITRNCSSSEAIQPTSHIQISLPQRWRTELTLPKPHPEAAYAERSSTNSQVIP